MACKDRKTRTVTKLTDGGKVPDNFQVGKDRMVFCNTPSTSNPLDLSYGSCNNGDPKVQTEEAEEFPMQPATSSGCCTNSTSCLSIIYRISTFFRSNFLVMSACCDFLNHVPDDSTDFGFSVVDQDSQRGLALAVFPSSAILDLQIFSLAFLKFLSSDFSP